MGEFFSKYNTEITWWIIGWLAFAFIDSLGRGQYFWAFVDAALIFMNYKLWKNNA